MTILYLTKCVKSGTFKDMKKISKIVIFYSIVLLISTVIGCVSTQSQEVSVEEFQDESTPQEIVEETQPEEPVELTEVDKEYYRSISNLNGEQSVSKSQFEQDKKNVLATIDKLSTIMAKSDYNGWLNYVTPEYKTFWSNEQNLKAIESRLPQKQLKIQSLQDYFKYVFIPARRGRQINEIRYISPTLIRAVQVSKDKETIYYTFEKVNNRWLISLDNN